MENGCVLANEKYTLTIDGKAITDKKGNKQLKTKENGILEHPIQPDAQKAELCLIDGIDRGEKFVLALGELDPIGLGNGIQARFRNLGFYHESTKDALKRFQDVYNFDLEKDKVKDTLEKVHDTDATLDIRPKFRYTPWMENFSHGNKDPYYVARSVVVEGQELTINTIVIPSPRIIAIIDAHMHIMSGHCTPLPLVWKKIEDNVHLWGLKVLAKGAAILRIGGSIKNLGIAQRNTYEIGVKALENNQRTYEKFQTQFPEYKKHQLYTPMVVLPMDMEYAHIEGYNGKTIRFNNLDPLFHPWKKQIQQTIKVVVKNPWQLIPMYHYEPRRWINDEKNWKKPFGCIATKTQSGLFVGIKMYTSLGYKPLDPKLRYKPLEPNKQWTNTPAEELLQFYKCCAKKQIPIMVHCTPGGMYTHERELYLDEEEDNRIAKKYKDKRVQYFNDNFVHPTAWKKVLEIDDCCKKLKLCLAHFSRNDEWRDKIIELCSHYPNVYTDISYVFYLGKDETHVKKNKKRGEKNYRDIFKECLQTQLENGNKTLLDRILFGTDWYVVNTKHILYDDYEKAKLKETKDPDGYSNYRNYCLASKEFLDKTTAEFRKTKGKDKKPLLDEEEDLWTLFTFINPFRYLGLDNTEVVDNISAALIKEGASQKKVDKYSAIIKRVGKCIPKLGNNNNNEGEQTQNKDEKKPLPECLHTLKTTNKK